MVPASSGGIRLSSEYLWSGRMSVYIGGWAQGEVRHNHPLVLPEPASLSTCHRYTHIYTFLLSEQCARSDSKLEGVRRNHMTISRNAYYNILSSSLFFLTTPLPIWARSPKSRPTRNHDQNCVIEDPAVLSRQTPIASCLVHRYSPGGTGK